MLRHERTPLLPLAWRLEARLSASRLALRHSLGSPFPARAVSVRGVLIAVQDRPSTLWIVCVCSSFSGPFHAPALWTRCKMFSQVFRRCAAGPGECPHLFEVERGWIVKHSDHCLFLT